MIKLKEDFIEMMGLYDARTLKLDEICFIKNIINDMESIKNMAETNDSGCRTITFGVYNISLRSDDFDYRGLVLDNILSTLYKKLDEITAEVDNYTIKLNNWRK